MVALNVWDSISTELSKLGYTISDKLSVGNDLESQVWKASFMNENSQVVDDGEQGQILTPELRALKITTSLSFDSDNPLRKLEDAAKREVNIMKMIHSDRIPAYLDVHEFKVADIVRVHVLATQFIDSQTAQTRIDSGVRLVKEDSARKFLDDILSALHHVHSELEYPVLHRDIKPSNILYNGTDAWLFDFNFSSVGTKTVSKTIIDNYGYYPMDAYSGRQTASQDLCAIGHVLIALAHGFDIARVREDQHKGSLDGVDVSDLPYSLSLQRFLKKLTTPNAAVRYQTARQALDDLRDLDSLGEILATRSESITRSSSMICLLDKLRAQDRIFVYNVPVSLLSTYDDDRLLDHIREVYKNEVFVVEGAVDVQKYIRYGCRVIKSGDYVQNSLKLPTGSEGFLIKAKNNEWLVDFYDLKFKHCLSPTDFVVNGIKKRFLFKKNIDVIFNAIPGDEFNGFQGYVPKGGLRKGLHVKYVGSERFISKNSDFIADGTPGVVYNVTRYDDGSCPHVFIAWEESPKLVAELYSWTSDGGTRWVRPKYTPKMDAIKLVVPNSINFSKLYAECYDVKR